VPVSNSKRKKPSKNTRYRERVSYLPVISNDPRKELTERLKLLYMGADRNRLGLMEARDSETEQPVQLIVGIEQNGPDTYTPYPLAIILTEMDADFLSTLEMPDMKGGWVKYNRA
jgi:hypothetical protein